MKAGGKEAETKVLSKSKAAKCMCACVCICVGVKRVHMYVKVCLRVRGSVRICVSLWC